MGLFSNKSMTSHMPLVGLTKTPPVTPFKFAAGVLTPRQLPGNGQR